jgi:hypothetical protein
MARHDPLYSEGDTWIVKCSCGWSAERKTKRAARAAWTKHVGNK